MKSEGPHILWQLELIGVSKAIERGPTRLRFITQEAILPENARKIRTASPHTIGELSQARQLLYTEPRYINSLNYIAQVPFDLTNVCSCCIDIRELVQPGTVRHHISGNLAAALSDLGVAETAGRCRHDIAKPLARHACLPALSDYPALGA